VLVLSVLGAGAVLLHAAIRRRLTAAFDNSSRDSRSAIRARSWIDRATAAGLLILAAGMVLLFLYPLLRDWPYFNLVTPLVIALGGSITAYALGASGSAAKLESASDSNQSPSVLLRPAVSVFTLVAVAASIFWATATVAQWSGLGLAQYRALHLDELPSVILDTKERLFLTSPGLDETVLPPSTGQTFHYRYRHLRLLIQGDDRMFLVPDRWSASDSTLLVRLDNNVRMQFQFANQAP
jgi:cation transporter-like permease